MPGGGIGQSRVMLLLLLQTAHLGEVSVTVLPQILKREEAIDLALGQGARRGRGI